METLIETPRILLVEDDINLGYLLVENLTGKGFDVTLANNGTEGAQMLSEKPFGLCILDIMLPGMDGYEVAGQLKKYVPAVPFIFLTARSLEKDRLKGFEAGADDYITKPFSFKELYYRIQVILRRIQKIQGAKDGVVGLGSVMLDPALRVLSVNGQQRKLSQRETELIYLLLVQRGNYVNRSEILKKVWGNDDYFTAKSMDVYITRIRKLLKDDPTIEVENLYGTGYRIRQHTNHF